MPLKSKKEKPDKKALKTQNYRESLAKQTGILFSPEITAAHEGVPVLKYFINALILFAAVYGSATCITSAFELEISIYPLLITCIISSLILSFMYMGKRTKIYIYILILILVIYSGIRYFSIINSGISGLRNNILKYVDNKVSLPFLREYNLSYSDEFTAMSVAICFAAIAVMILLNIMVSEKMSLRGVFLLTFPFVQLGMYFNFATAKYSMMLVLVSWVLVAVTNLSDSYNGLTRKMISKSSVKKHSHRYGFVTDSKNTAQIALAWLCFTLVITGLVFSVVPSSNFELELPTNEIKNNTERQAKNILSYGLSSLYSVDRNGAAPGSLANVSSIAFDGMADYKVTLVDYGVERIYLKNFAGNVYDGDSMRWFPVKHEYDRGKLYNYTAALMKNDFLTGKKVSQSEHKMTVRTVDPNLESSPVCVPYFSVLSDEEYRFETSSQAYILPGSGINADDPLEFTAYTMDSYTTDYSVLLEQVEDKELKENLNETLDVLKTDAYENNLTVPETNIKAIEKFCSVYGITPGNTSAINDVVSAFQDDFTYTLRPGKIPYGEDYVNYFLLATQKGYCQHFASAATLIFRYLGIPARYVEGYVIDAYDYENATTLKDENASDWINPSSDDDTVVEISVPDSSGHAWVEVFIDDIGWIPVEVTTAVADDSGAGFLANLFAGRNPISNENSAVADTVRKLNAESTQNKIKVLPLVIVIMLLTAYAVRVIYIVVKRRKLTGSDNLRQNLSNRCVQLFRLYDFSGKSKNSNLSYEEFFEIMQSDNYMTGAAEFTQTLEKALFGENEPEPENYQTLCTAMSDCRKSMVKNLPFLKKAKYYLVNCGLLK